MKRLISALGAGRGVVFYGAGPSSELGLPNWRKLTEEIISAGKKELGSLPPSISSDLEAERFPKVIGEIERLLNKKGRDGRRFIEEVVRRILGSASGTGETYKLLAKIPVNLFITTNIESAFENHLKRARYTPSIHINSRESLEEFDPASYDKSIIYAHGSLDHGDLPPIM